MKTNSIGGSAILVPQVSGYTELQREMRDALRAQHPEWIEADGTSPTCDYYEWRLAALLIGHRAHYDNLLQITKPDHFSDAEIPACPLDMLRLET